eukprot:TRINITY_DN778035_c0_g1_i1.p1 TRINITY_DN778035_c0_g1~~TRINITY_DN778035_c0_g1_i1.p1  ORF type:complete len:383 (+),score=85.19 TRINITY_DN778035_c0_g1_i1:77-1225(+)
MSEPILWKKFKENLLMNIILKADQFGDEYVAFCKDNSIEIPTKKFEQLEYAKESANLVRKQLEILTCDEMKTGWTFLKNKNDTKIHKKRVSEEGKDDVVWTKLEGYINGSIPHLISLLYEHELYSEWIPMIGQSICLQNPTEFSKVLQLSSKFPMIIPMSNRDAVISANAYDLLEEHRSLLIIVKPPENDHTQHATQSEAEDTEATENTTTTTENPMGAMSFLTSGLETTSITTSADPSESEKPSKKQDEKADDEDNDSGFFKFECDDIPDVLKGHVRSYVKSYIMLTVTGPRQVLFRSVFEVNPKIRFIPDSVVSCLQSRFSYLLLHKIRKQMCTIESNQKYTDSIECRKQLYTRIEKMIEVLEVNENATNEEIIDTISII